MKNSYVHVYTGNGKGKTTAAIGLAVRAAMSGMNVYIGQFIKGMKYNECKITDYVKNITIEQLGRCCFIDKEPTEQDKKIARDGFEKCKNILKSNKYNLVILDEITIAFFYKLIDVKEVISAIQNRNKDIEVVITGRYAPKEIIEIADLVTEMKEIKHYYTQGVLSRNGIDR